MTLTELWLNVQQSPYLATATFVPGGRELFSRNNLLQQPWSGWTGINKNGDGFAGCCPPTSTGSFFKIRIDPACFLGCQTYKIGEFQVFPRAAARPEAR